LRAKLDSTASLISVTGPEWLFNLMLNGEKGNLFIQDNRIANCRFGKKYLNNYIKFVENKTYLDIADKYEELAYLVKKEEPEVETV
jgi:hypothetical protein